MKTQLLEDIGQSATLSLTPSKTAGKSKANKEVPKPATAANAEPGKLRSNAGLWRQRPAEVPQISTTQQSEQQPVSVDLDNVFEELAALEAQYVAPVQPHEPAAPATPAATATPIATPAAASSVAPASAAAPAAAPQPLEPRLLRPAHPAEPALPPQPMHSATAPQDPLFDFTPPAPERQTADPFTPTWSGDTRAKPRYLLWAAGVLACALLIQGGRWFYQERSDAGSLALVADQATAAPQAATQPALAARAATPGPDTDAPVTVPAGRPVSEPPPLVLLERDPSTATEAKQPAALDAGQARPETAPEPAARQESAAPKPKPKARPQSKPQPSSRTARRQPEAVAEPVGKSAKREPVRQLARASASERPAGRDTTMTATLKACREHGYDAAQCVKRACSLTQYGFACRGR